MFEFSTREDVVRWFHAVSVASLAEAEGQLYVRIHELLEQEFDQAMVAAGECPLCFPRGCRCLTPSRTPLLEAVQMADDVVWVDAYTGEILG